MRKTSIIFANTVLAVALAAPVAMAEDWNAELQKDTRQMHEAARNGDRKGVENERREIIKDRQALARDRGLSGDGYYGRDVYGNYDGSYGDRGHHYGNYREHHDNGNHYGWYKHHKHGYRHHRHHHDD